MCIRDRYEFLQLQSLKSQLNYEYDQFQQQNYSTNFQNITGFKLAYHDSASAPDLNATYPIPDKDYDSWARTESYMMLPQEIINKVEREVWAAKESLYPPNITSNLYGKINLLENQKYARIKMPIPSYCDPPTSFQDERPPDGEHYLNFDENGDAGNHGELHNVTWKHGSIDVSIQHMDTVTNSVGLSPHIITPQEYRFNDQDGHWKILNLDLNFYDKQELEKHSVSAKGIYDVATGRILVMSQSAKFHSCLLYTSRCV